MEGQYEHSRLDRAKELLIAGRREDGDGERKKKKHREDRLSRSRSRDQRKRSRSHKKEHKHREREPKDHKDREHKDKHRQHKDKDREHKSKEREHKDREPKEKEHREHREREPEKRDYRDREPRERQSDRAYERPREQRDYRDHRDNRDNYRDNNNFRGGMRRRDEQRPVEEKDPYFERRKDIETTRVTDPDKAALMEIELQKQQIFDNKQKQLEQAKQKFREAQKEMEEAKREDHTILVYCLPLKAKERDIWNFFSKTNCGKIRDIRIIRDNRSGRSKGVAYVEFYTSDAVQKALTMTDRPFQLKGREFMGLRVQHSQAEKNRAAAAAKQMRLIKPVDAMEQQQETLRRQTKVVVGGLIDSLAQMMESELKELFEPFGEIEYVDIHRDPQTGRCKGFAFIQYANTECAKAAVRDMNGLLIRKQKISVQTVSVTQRGEVSASDQFVYSAGTKANLMNKLSHAGPSHSNLMRPPISTVTTPYLIMTNMFKMEGTTPQFFEELKKAIQAESDAFGVVERIFVEKNNQGNIWIKYSDTASALKAQENLNGKFFDGHKIFCYFVTENTYQTRVGT